MKISVFCRLVLFISFCISFFPGQSQTSRSQSFLHTDGQYIEDEAGNKILLRGVGLGNWMLPEGYMWKFREHGDRPRRIEKIVSDFIGPEKAQRFWKEYRRNYITKADIKRIAELGYNSVRPALNSRLFLTEGENNKFIDEGFQLMDSLINWCKKYHLYVIIDMHAAPGGQTGQNIDDSANDQPELFTNPENQDLLVILWKKIAARYKDEPTVAAYDLLNEPLPENTGAAEKYKDQLVPVYLKVISAIREVDQRHMITLEGYNWANNWSLFGKSPDNNLFFQFHYYCWNQPDNLNDISGYLEKREQLGTPVWVGETGEKNNTIYFATTQYFEKNNIGWSFWPWKKMDTSNTPYSITPPKGWEQIEAYSKSGKAPKADKPEQIFNELLENVKLENCTFFPDVVNAMFRQIPLKIEAENYGPDGCQKSYFVKDTTSRSEFYRKNEPVKISLTADSRGQYITLNSGEWTSYRFKSPDTKRYQVSLQIKSESPQSGIVVTINGNRVTQEISSSNWTEIQLPQQFFQKGNNELIISVVSGSINLDWINIYQ